MSSFYLFSLELRRHSETTFHYGVSPLTDAVRPDFFSRQIYCSNGPFSFPHETSPYEFVSRTIRAIALCIPTVHHFTRKMHGHLKAVFFCKKENSALSEHTCLTNHTIGWDNSKIITTNRRCHQRLCLEAWHINSAHAPLNRDDGGLLPDAYFHLFIKKAAY